MEAAMEEHPVLTKDDEARKALSKYFRYTAHYIVVASQFMRPDQVRPNLPEQMSRIWNKKMHGESSTQRFLFELLQ